METEENKFKIKQKLNQEIRLQNVTTTSIEWELEIHSEKENGLINYEFLLS